MKTIKMIMGVILFISIFATSCSKDDDSAKIPTVATPLVPEQNPLSGYLTTTGFDQKVTNRVNQGDFEFGYSFIPLVNGKMTAIIAKIPDVHMGMRVTVWDKTAGIVLRSETIDNATAGVAVTKTIAALDLVKDKEYFLTMNSNDWYECRRTDNAIANYPITVGDIKITSYSFVEGTAQTMPNAPQNYYFAGECTFKFQK